MSLRLRPAWLVLLIGCGDNLLDPPIDAHPDAPMVTIDAPPDAPPSLLPDLVPVASQMNGSIVITNDTFTAGSCEMVEQCIGDVGTRHLLRFDTVTANVGQADLQLGMPPAPGVSDPPFTWSPCHGHHHFDGYASYELLDGANVIVAGHKQAFCVLDTQRVTTGAPSNGYNCTNQGLSAGWADVYARGLPCQWIDVTDVATHGTYTLRVRINPEGAITESDSTNNEWTISVGL